MSYGAIFLGSQLLLACLLQLEAARPPGSMLSAILSGASLKNDKDMNAKLAYMCAYMYMYICIHVYIYIQINICL